MKKRKLELTWDGKDEPLKVEPRILLYDKEKSYGDQNSGNMLIHGDNLLALKALEAKYTGQIKCVYIDPPYNTGSAFEKYDDNFEHSIWLNLMYHRINLLRELLSEDGSIWVTLDDNEVFHCKVMMDEIFGRNNFVGSVIWEKADSPKMDPKFFSTSHDIILVYANDIEKLSINREFSDEIPKHYNRIDEKGKRYYLKPMRVMGGNVSESLYYPMVAPDGTEVYPISSKGQKTCWRWSKKKVEEEANRIEWVNGKNGWSLYFRIYADTRKGMPIRTIWHHQEVGTNRTSKAEINALFGTNTFDTPKPEKLLQRVISAVTNPGDIVLDSFLGSGTTAAVAHKMNRRYIGIEMGDHAYTHCKVRLDKVIDGDDAGGITKSVNWQGGGGYRFYELANTLVKLDSHGEHIISEEYDAEKLAAAVALHEGYTYAPDKECFWKQAVGSENSYLFTTTRTITRPYLDSIAQTMAAGEYLTIASTAFAEELTRAYKNIDLKYIPEMLLKKCTFGVDNYNLPIIDTPVVEDDETEEADDE